MSWGGRIRRSAEIWRQEGPRTLWFRFLGETVYRRMFLFERAMEDPLGAFEIGLAATVNAAAEPAGHWRFMVRHKGRIVSSCRVGVGSASVPYLNRELLLGERDIYIYDLYTLPEFRQFNLSMALTRAYVDHFRALGYTRSISAIMPENPAGIRAAEKRGSRRFCTIGYVRLGFWRWDFCRVDKGSVVVSWKPCAG